MSCQNCNQTTFTPNLPELCIECEDTCEISMDSACVIYKPGGTTPSSLTNLSLPNSASVKEILEEIDRLIGQNFNLDLTVLQSNSIQLTANGAAKHTLRADVKISPDANNKLQLRANGLYVA